MSFNRKVIDSHWHLYPFADKNGEDFYTILDRYKQTLGLSALNICSIPCYDDLGPAQNLLPLLYKLHDPTAFAHGGFVYTSKPASFPQPDGFDLLTQYNELMELGFDGIKLLEAKPFEQRAYKVRLDSSDFDSFFAAAQRDSTHIICHAADPATFWDINKIPAHFISRGWFYGDGTYLGYDEIYDMLKRVLERYPELSITFAHFFFLSGQPERLEELFEKYPKMAIDITPGAEMYADFRENLELYREFFERKSKRILFGTDASFTENDLFKHYLNIVDQTYGFVAGEDEVQIYAEKCPAIGISESARDDLLYKNFERRVGAAPRPVNVPAMKKYLEKYKPYFTDLALLERLEVAIGEL